jgi:hypothetical protein
VLLITSLIISSCTFWGVRGNGKVKKEKRNLTEFTQIDASGAFTIKIHVGENPSLVLRAEENLLPLIKTSVIDDILVIDTKKNLSPRKEIIIEITTTDLTNVECSGANDIYVENIDTDDFVLDLSGAGNIELLGFADKFRAEISGAGSLNAKQLKASRVYISVSGAASAKVFAKEFIDASVSGVGSIDYYGNPKEVNTNVSGVGSISRK